MNRTDECLNRILKAAARAPQDLPAEPPFWLEARVLAGWRRGLEPAPTALLIPVIQRAFFCACAILVISAAITFRATQEPPPSELVIVDSAIQLNLLP